MHERLNNVVVTTKKLNKLQRQSLRVINDNFKTISMQILETKIHVQFIQLRMICLQIFFKQCMKDHKHNTLIRSFCEQIKHCLFETRRQRKRRTHETFVERKIKWTLKMCIKLFEKKKKMKFQFTKLSSSSFWKNENTCNVFIKCKIDAKFAKRWWRTSRSRKWSCTKIWQNWKAFSSRIWERNKSNKLIISFFVASSLCYLRVVSANIRDKCLDTCFSFVRTDSKSVNACCEKKKQRTWKNLSTWKKD